MCISYFNIVLDVLNRGGGGGGGWGGCISGHFQQTTSMSSFNEFD